MIQCRYMDESACHHMMTIHGWVLGLVITLQLACMAWLGWISARVVAQNVDTAVLSSQMQDIKKQQDGINTKVDKIYDKISKLP